MFTFQVSRLQLDMLSEANRDDNIELLAKAQALFRHAALKGKRRKVWAKLTGRSPYLLDLAGVKTRKVVVASHDEGTQAIPLAQIRGSEGRSQDFDSQFHPLQEHTKQRWMTVARAWLTDVSLPPVQVVQVNDLYFVRDGHHRISVARTMGQTFIDAKVTQWDVYEPKSCPSTPYFCPCACFAA